MSLLKTKPSWAPNAIPTDRGWTDPITNEVYVAIGNLKSKLEAEQKVIVPEIQEIVHEPAPIKTKGSKVKKEDKKKLEEQVQVKLDESQQLLGEVVEIKLSDKQEDITE